MQRDYHLLRVATDEDEDACHPILALVFRRSRARGICRHVVILIRYLLYSQHPWDDYANCSRRRLSSDLRMSVSEVRTALTKLREWGWVERRPSAGKTAAAYRLTVRFLGDLKTMDEAAVESLPDHLNARSGSNPEVPDGNPLVEPADRAPRQALQQLSLPQLVHRVFDLNRKQREHYRRAYRKGTLRNVCKVLHWFLQSEARQPGAPVLISLRQLAAQTDLVFDTAKRARDQLVAWNVLVQDGDAYHLDHHRLAGILEGDEAGLPLPPAPKHTGFIVLAAQPGIEHAGRESEQPEPHKP